MIFYNKISDSQLIKKYLLKFDNVLPNLKNRVVIDLYAQKLADNAEVYVMSNNNVDIGFLVFYANNLVENVAYLTIICIDEPFQSKHYGKKLLNFCQYECVRKKMQKIRLEVRRQRYYAIKFYLNNGFYEYDKNDEFLYMEKDLKDKDE